MSGPRGRSPIRWWPAVLVAGATSAAVAIVRAQGGWPYQTRNLTTLSLLLSGLVLLWLWWLLLSRAPWRWRLVVCGGSALGVAWVAALFRIAGVSGDLLPILEPRWVGRPASEAREAPVSTLAGGRPGADTPELAVTSTRAGPDFPEFLGPQRNGVLESPRLDPDWSARPPEVLWRRSIGPGWSGFAMVAERAVTQEQNGEEELVSCWSLATGERRWTHSDTARYATTIAGEGPRCTPTIVGDRVYTLGATGLLNCLRLDDGRAIWQRSLIEDAGATVPEWGYAGSPLYDGGRVIVSAGGREGRSLLAYDAERGDMVWAGGSAPAGYSSPVLATLAGVPQILMFNGRRIAAHAPDTGTVLWDYPWGVGHPHVAVPVVVSSNRVVFSSGYGVGAELLEVAAAGPDLSVARIWKTIRLKAKFANFVAWDGHLYGLDDGVLACVDLADGSQKWKEGRYGHGQMLRLGELLLVMAENGELVLLRPTPEAPHELHRFRVFGAKTWNPPALAGDRLLVRNDREAVALRLALANE